jgi:hypothetical protein
MNKRDEVSNPESCWNRAKDDEMCFVLLARDITAPSVIRFWIAERLRTGKNTAGDPQIAHALECIRTMEEQQRRSKKHVHPST